MSACWSQFPRRHGICLLSQANMLRLGLCLVRKGPFGFSVSRIWPVFWFGFSVVELKIYNFSVMVSCAVCEFWGDHLYSILPRLSFRGMYDKPCLFSSRRLFGSWRLPSKRLCLKYHAAGINILCTLTLDWTVELLYLNRTITRLFEGILFICGPSSIICARAERGCKWCYEGHK